MEIVNDKRIVDLLGEEILETSNEIEFGQFQEATSP